MAKGLFVFLISIFTSALSFAGTFSADSIGRKNVDGKEFIIYMVSAGETVYGISTKYQVSVDELMTHNPELEKGLRTGQILNIPYNAELVKNNQNSGKKVHIVKPGETLYSISKQYNIPLGDLLKWNGMELKAGQELYVSAPTPQKPATIETNPVVVQKNDTEIKKENPTQTKVEKETVLEPKTEVKITSGSTGDAPYWESTERSPELGPKLMKRVMVIPFDPYLYFSDADDEIAMTSNVHRTRVRQVFRRRLNALLEPKGYETIHLLGGMLKDSLGDLNKIYKGVTYNYQEILNNGTTENENFINNDPKKKKTIQQKLTEELNINQFRKPTPPVDNRYFGVQIRDPRFFDYFKTKYDIDYYIFINQFEVKTDYQTCLDRASQNYQRDFHTHYSIFDDKGNQLAGNKITTHYQSNSGNIYQIVKDNMPQVADEIMKQLPPPGY